jgi:hypothetical protein
MTCFTIPSTFNDCPNWWKNFINDIFKEHNNFKKIDGHVRTEYIVKEFKKYEASYYDFGYTQHATVNFKNSELQLVFMLRYDSPT